MLHGHAVFHGEVGHQRLLPRQHGFSYPIALYWLDCEQLDNATLKQHGVGFEQFSALSYRRSDYLPGEAGLLESVKAKVQALGGTGTVAHVFVLTPLANWGLYFSPLTLYYCFDDKQQFCYLLAEVTNTPWNERHYYLHQIMPQQSTYQHDKCFHVSPFHPMDMQYHWHISEPEQSLDCSIRNMQGEQQVFSAWINLQRHTLDASWKRYWLIRRPWQNVQVVLRIYWHAMLLFFKRIPVHAHPKTKDTPV